MEEKRNKNQESQENKNLNKLPSKPTTVLRGHKGPVYVAKFNQNGNYCMTGSADRHIILWNPINGKLIKTYKGAHNYEVTDLLVMEDNTRFISCGGDKSGFMWDVKSGNVLRKFGGHTQKINTIQLNSDESVLATGSYDATMKLWDLKSYNYQPIQTIKTFKDSVTKIIIDGFNIYASSIDGNVYNYDIRYGEVTKDDFKTSVHNMSLSNDKKTYVASTLDNNIKLVEKDTGEILQSFKGHKCLSYSVGINYSWDDAYILSGSEDGSMVYYDFYTGKIAKQLKNHCRNVSCIQLNKQKTGLLTASYDNTVTYWTIENKDQNNYNNPINIEDRFHPEDPQNYMWTNDSIL